MICGFLDRCTQLSEKDRNILNSEQKVNKHQSHSSVASQASDQKEFSVFLGLNKVCPVLTQHSACYFYLFTHRLSFPPLSSTHLFCPLVSHLLASRLLIPHMLTPSSFIFQAFNSIPCPNTLHKSPHFIFLISLKFWTMRNYLYSQLNSVVTRAVQLYSLNCPEYMCRCVYRHV